MSQSFVDCVGGGLLTPTAVTGVLDFSQSSIQNNWQLAVKTVVKGTSFPTLWLGQLLLQASQHVSRERWPSLATPMLEPSGGSSAFWKAAAAHPGRPGNAPLGFSAPTVEHCRLCSALLMRATQRNSFLLALSCLLGHGLLLSLRLPGYLRFARRHLSFPGAAGRYPCMILSQAVLPLEHTHS